MALANKLCEVLRLGDKIRVMAGKDNICCGKGSYIHSADNFLIWANHDGDILFTHLGNTVSVKKV